MVRFLGMGFVVGLPILTFGGETTYQAKEVKRSGFLDDSFPLTDSPHSP